MVKKFFTLLMLLSSLCMEAAGVKKSKAQVTSIPYQWLGRVEPGKRAVVRALVSGKVLKKLYRVGQKSSKGDNLLYIQSRAAQKSVEASEVALDQAKTAWDNASLLYAKKMGSKVEKDKAHVVYKVALANFESHRESVESATVTAPFDSVVYSDEVDEGTGVVQGMKLCEVASLDEAHVHMQVEPKDLAWMRKHKGDFSVSDSENVLQKASWFAQSPCLSEKTGLVEVVLHSKGQAFVFGSYVYVTVLRANMACVHVVPLRALHFEKGRVGLLCLNENVTVFQPAKLLSVVDEQAYLINLPQEVTYIAEGHGDFFDGEKIDVNLCYAISSS